MIALPSAKTAERKRRVWRGGWKCGSLALGCVAVLLLPAGGAGSATGEWRRRLESDGIRVDVRSVQGSGYEEFRGEVDFAAEVEAVVEVVLDVPGHVGWVHLAVEARPTARGAGESGRTYHRYDFPWPASDRDVLMDWSIERAGRAVVFHMTRSSERAPPRSDVIPLAVYRGFFRVEPREAGRVRVTFQLHTEPGGWLPRALVNRLAVELPLETLRGLRHRIVSDSP